MVDPPAGGLLNSMYYIYVLFNRLRNKIYIGQTNNIEIRLKRHNQELPTKLKSYTNINSGKWELIYKEDFKTRQEAVKREKELKSYQGRKYIKNNILKYLGSVAQW